MIDETPLRVRVAFGPDEGGGLPQLAKVYVGEAQWCLLVKKITLDGDGPQADQYLLLQSKFSPRILCSDTSTSSAIAAVMQRIPRASQKVYDLFNRRIRVNEQDEGPANAKAHRLFAHCLPKPWSTLTWFCSGHKAHTISDKVISLAKESSRAS